MTDKTKQPVQPGDWISDKNGRSGTVVSASWDETLEDWVVVVDPGYGIMIDLRGELISFIQPTT